MKFENSNWRFKSPGALNDIAVYRFYELAHVTAAQGDLWAVIEMFKQHFPAASGYWKSSEAKYAASDLQRDMQLYSSNAPLFIEKFFLACSDISKQGLDVPDLDAINSVLAETQAGYQIDGDVLVASKTPGELIQGSFAKRTSANPIFDIEIFGGGKAKEEKAEEIGLRVFLCHSSIDKSAVKDLYARLKADGFDPWLDAVNLKPGQTWEFEIERAVKNTHVVIVCLSKTSVSKVGFAQREIKLALDVADMQPEGRIFIIPARLEDCDVPNRLSKWHWVNLHEKDGYDRLVDSLLECAASL